MPVKLYKPEYMYALADASFQTVCAHISNDYLTIIKRDLVPQLHGFEGIGLRELRTVMVVDYFDDQATSQLIAENLRYDKGTASRTTQKLLRLGYISRLDNQEDARSAFFVVTEKGKKLALRYKDICERHFSYLEQWAGTELTDEEREIAFEVLFKLRERTRKMLEPPRRRYRRAATQ